MSLFTRAIVSNILIILFTVIVVVAQAHVPPETPAPLLTKQQAFENLKKNGFKWRLTETLAMEAHGKTEQEKSASAFKAEFIMRQIAAKINPAQYGLENKIDNDVIGLGTTAIGFSYSIYDPIAEVKIGGALAQEHIAEQQSRQFQHELTALMLIQYASVQKLARQLSATKMSLARAQLIFKLAQTKVRIGAGVNTDISKAKSLLESESIKKLNLEIKMTKARHDLNQLLGLRNETFTLEDMAESSMKIRSTEKADLDLARTQRSDYLLAASGAEATARASEKLEGNFWPKLALVGDVGTTDITAFGLPGRSLGGLVGISLTIPLDTGGYLEGKRAETLALKYRSSINLQQSESDIDVQVKETREQIQAAGEAVKIAGNFVKLTNEEMQLVQKKYQAGSANSLDVATAHSSLASALDTQTEALFNYEAAKIQYYRATGNFEGYFK